MKVFVKKVQAIQPDLEILLNCLNWKKLIKKDDTVLIKPNFCTNNLKDGVTTNLSLIKSLVDLLNTRAGEVIVGETISNWNNLDRLIKKLDFGCDFVNLSNLESKQFESSFGSLRLPKIVFESKLVNLPVLKTHVLTKLTVGIKNLFGLLQLKEKYKYHKVIDELLLELLGLVKPELNILDATHTMIGRGGPISGKVIKTNLLFASEDVVSLDIMASRFYCMDTSDVRHINLAAKRFGSEAELYGDIEEIE
jgi:uncharacterized protein (DUF362 family)